MQSTDSILRHLLLQDALSHWKQFKDDQQRQWKECIVIEAKLNHLYLKRTLRYWYTWRAQSRECDDKQSTKHKTVKATNTIRSKRCLRFWHHYIHSVFQLQKEWIKASAHLNINQQRQCILQWKQITNKRRNLDLKYEECVVILNNKSIHNAFSRWKEAQVLKQRLLKMSVLWSKYSNRLRLIRSYNEWMKRYHQSNRKHEIARKYCEYKTKKKIWNAFELNMIFNEGRKDKLNAILSTRCDAEYLNQNGLKLAFITWKQNTQQINSIRRKIESQIKVEVVLAWQRSSMKRQRLIYFANKVACKHHVFELRLLWMEWKGAVIRNTRSELLVLSNCLQFWYKMSRKHAENSCKCNILCAWIDEKQLKSVWFNWYLQTLHQIEMRDKSDIAVHFYGYKIKSILFLKWKAFKVNHHKQKLLTKKLKNSQKTSVKRKVLNHWFGVFYQYQQHHRITQITQRFLLLKSIRFWHKSKVSSKKRKRFNEFKARLWRLRSYFKKWLMVYEPAKIGNRYEEQITISCKPFMISLQKERNARRLYVALNVWFISYAKRRKRERKIYSWNQSIVTGIIDNIFALDRVELLLKQLLSQKMWFKQQCKQWIHVSQLKRKNKKELHLCQQLEIDIRKYLMHKEQRRKKIALVITQLTHLHA
eukprot:231964_1